MPHDEDTNCIVEFISMGNYVKVTAIDPATGREVSMVGDPKQTKDELMRLAARKLRYVLEKEKK